MTKRTAWWSLHSRGRDISPGDPRRGRRGIADQRRRVAQRPATGLRSRWYDRVARKRAWLGSAHPADGPHRAGGAMHRQLPTLVEKAKHMVAFSTRSPRGSRNLSSKASRRVSAPRHIGRGRGLCNTLSPAETLTNGGQLSQSSTFAVPARCGIGQRRARARSQRRCAESTLGTTWVGHRGAATTRCPIDRLPPGGEERAQQVA
jgi:hypothetical protein